MTLHCWNLGAKDCINTQHCMNCVVKAGRAGLHLLYGGVDLSFSDTLVVVPNIGLRMRWRHPYTARQLKQRAARYRTQRSLADCAVPLAEAVHQRPRGDSR